MTREVKETKDKVAQQTELFRQTLLFITGHGALRIIGAILVIFSVPLASAGGVLSNSCDAPSPRAIVTDSARRSLPVENTRTTLIDVELAADNKT